MGRCNFFYRSDFWLHLLRLYQVDKAFSDIIKFIHEWKLRFVHTPPPIPKCINSYVDESVEAYEIRIFKVTWKFWDAFPLLGHFENARHEKMPNDQK